MSVKNSVYPLEYFTIDVSTIGAGVWSPVNSPGFIYPVFLLRLVNDSNVDVFVSYDGSTFNDFVPANESVQLNFQTNNRPDNHVALMAKNTIVYVSGVAGVGTFYVIGYAQRNQNG